MAKELASWVLSNVSSSFLDRQVFDIQLFTRSTISYEAYVSFIPPAKRPELEKKLDYQFNGVDKHLHIIAAALLDWEDLIPHLDLTQIDKSDILYERTPSQQRYQQGFI